MLATALSDLKVLEVGSRLSAGVAGRLMADLGADVVKIEGPGGDPARRAGPFPDDAPDLERSGLFVYLSRGKRSVTFDLETAAGRDAARRLAAGCDIVLHGDLARGIDRSGLAYDALKDANPRVVCTAVTPMGLTGPWRDYEAPELVITALSGVGYYIPGGVRSPREEPPLLPGASIASFTAGAQAANATMMAIFARKASGAGCQVDVAESECLTDTLRFYLANAEYDLEDYPRTFARRLAGGAPYWQCADGFIWGLPAQNTDENVWLNIIDVLGNPEWATDPELLDSEVRAARWPELLPKLQAAVREVSKHKLAAAVQERHIPCLPVNDVAELFHDIQLTEHRSAFTQLDPERLPGALVPKNPIRYDGQQIEPHGPAPRLGQHTAEVLRGAGFSDGEIRALSAS